MLTVEKSLELTQPVSFILCSFTLKHYVHKTSPKKSRWYSIPRYQLQVKTNSIHELSIIEMF